MSAARLVSLALLLSTVDAAAQPARATTAKQVTQLLGDLSSDDPTVRGAAAVDLQMVFGPAVVPPLIEAANVGAPAARLHAMRALGRLGATAAVPHLVALLRDPSWEVRIGARGALAAIGAPAVPRLVSLLGRMDLGGRQDLIDSGSLDWRGEAALTLAAIGPRALQPLQRALANAAGDRRRYVLAALAGLDDTRAGDTLLAEGRSTDPERRQDAVAAAAEALQTLMQPDQGDYAETQTIARRLVRVLDQGFRDALSIVRVQALRSADDLSRSNQMLADRGFGIDLTFDLTAIAGSVGHEDADVRVTAVQALESTGADGALAALSRNPDPAIREAASRALKARPAAPPDPLEVAADTNRDVDDRISAIDAIVDTQLESGVLVEMLNDGEARIRAAAADALANYGGERADAVGPLVGALDDPSAAVRVAALRALSDIGVTSGVDDVGKLMSDGPRDVRLAAIQAVGQLNVTAVAPQLLALVTGDPDYREAAADAFARLRTPTTAADLLALASHQSFAVRLVAVRRFGRVGGIAELPGYAAALDRAIRDDNPAMRLAAVALLHRADSDAAFGHIERALSDSDRDVRGEALRALSNSGSTQAPQALAGLSRTVDPELRAASVKGLAAIADSGSRERLGELLLDPDPLVVALAVAALAQLRDARVVDTLLARLRHQQAQVRAAAAVALERFDEATAATALMGALKDENHEVRDAAARTLGKLGARSAVPALIDAVRVQRMEEAAAALGQIGDARALEPLLAAARDRRIPEHAVINALGVLGDRRASGWLFEKVESPEGWMRDAAVLALGQLKDPRSVNLLIGRLSSPDPGIRARAANALGEVGDPRVVPTLLATFLRSLDRDGALTEATSTALARFGPAAIDHVAPLLDSRPSDRLSVVFALSRFGPEATPALIKALDLEEPSARTTAAAFLARRDGPLVASALLLRLEDPSIVAAAYEFFLKHLDDRVVDALVRSINELGGGKERARAYIASGHPRLVEAGRAFLGLN